MGKLAGSSPFLASFFCLPFSLFAKFAEKPRQPGSQGRREPQGPADRHPNSFPVNSQNIMFLLVNIDCPFLFKI